MFLILFVFCCNRYWCFAHKADRQKLFRKAAVKTGALTPSTVWSFPEYIWSDSILRLTFLYSYVLCRICYTVPDFHIVHSNQNLISVMSCFEREEMKNCSEWDGVTFLSAEWSTWKCILVLSPKIPILF